MRIVRALLLAASAIIALSAAAFAFLAWESEIAPVARPNPDGFEFATIDRGEMLARLGACHECHTDPAGGADYAGGRALPTPFGTVRSTNITPDPETGIGTWSTEAFRRAMREGIDRAGRHLYPVFPYDHFTRTTDEDLDALYAFLMTREPVSTPNPPANALQVPLTFRPVLAIWNLLHLDPGPFVPDPSRDEDWNRGAYLVEGLGHCGSCHTPRDWLGGLERDRAFAGGEAEGWHAPALGAASTAPVPWTADAFVNYMLDGWDQDHGIAAGPMAPVVENMAYLSEDDIYAMAAYLLPPEDETAAARADAARRFAEERSVGGPNEAAPLADLAADPALGRGEETFLRICANCHKAGSQSAPLSLTASVTAPDPRNLVHIILDGIRPPEGAPERAMPGFAASLSDGELADLAAYTRARFTDRPAWPDLDRTIATIRRREGG